MARRRDAIESTLEKLASVVHIRVEPSRLPRRVAVIDHLQGGMREVLRRSTIERVRAVDDESRSERLAELARRVRSSDHEPDSTDLLDRNRVVFVAVRRGFEQRLDHRLVLEITSSVSSVFRVLSLAAAASVYLALQRPYDGG